VQTAPDAAPSAKRPNTRSDAPPVFATRLDWVTRYGLSASRFSARCPQCQQKRLHVSDGERRCPCGQHYQVVVATVVS
jgi:hypothetical protein